MSVIVAPGDLVLVDPNDARAIEFDWDVENLAPSITISSTFTITPILQHGATPLSMDSETVLPGGRKTKVRIDAATASVRDRYALANTVTTNEVPPQTKTQSIQILIVPR